MRIGKSWVEAKNSNELTEAIPICINERFEQWVEQQPDKLLFAFLDRRGDITSQYSYKEFSERVSIIAGQLATRNELNPGDRLLLLYPPGLEVICALFACSKAGFIAVPAPPPSSHGFAASAYRLAHMIEDSGASAILIGNETRGILQDNLGTTELSEADDVAENLRKLKWIATEDMTKEAEVDLVRLPHEVFFLQYTSGSTNQPKGVMVTHENILHNCDLVVDHENPIAVSWLPQHHDMGLIGYYIYIALSGGTTYGFSPKTFIQKPSLWLETISKYRATASSAPNFAFDICVQEKRVPCNVLESLDLSSLKILMAAAEPIKVDTYQNFLRKFEPYGLNSKNFFVAYGLAEFTLGVTFYGRTFLSLNKRHLAGGRAKPIKNASEIVDKVHLISCGTPLGDNEVKIVNSETFNSMADNQVGEIWISGKSKCFGYWNKSGLSTEIFNAAVTGDEETIGGFLRTGDMGFLHKGELYVCGRQKDMIIVRGQNHFPQDIERITEDNFPQLRKGFVAAFESLDGDGSSVTLVAEVAKKNDIPDARDVVKAVWKGLDLRVTKVVYVLPRSIAKTSSGKIRRFKTRQLLQEEKLKIIAIYDFEQSDCPHEYDDRNELMRLKIRYNLTGNEEFTLLDAGIDSFDLVVFLHWLKETVAEKGAHLLSEKLDAKMLGTVTVREIFVLSELLESSHDAAIFEVRQMLLARYEKNLADEKIAMLRDSKLDFLPARPDYANALTETKNVLLTGGTGFLGPFLLSNILSQTTAKVYVLTRAANSDQALQRIRDSLKGVGHCDAELEAFVKRVIPICGDLEAPNLNLTQKQWDELANSVDTIYHNGAIVNYLLDYQRMRAANVTGTNEILKLAFAGRAKQFNHISTTFIFGWATKDYLYENDNNGNMELLDFGYSQSKWVSEQLVHDAKEKGLATRIFRPALITPSIDGGGENFDITIRLLLFMIDHGIGVTAKNQVSFMPADVTANNIVAIANQSETTDGVFHVTRDNYESMSDITDLITQKTGRNFNKFSIRDFVPEVVRRCSKDDLLFPLLDFLIGSVDNISSMEFKLYESSEYKKFRQASQNGKADPPLSDIVDGILNFLKQKQLI